MNKLISTISILKLDLQIINKWCKLKNMNQFELIHEWINQVKLKKQSEFYNSLSMPSNFRKPLINIKIDKKYIKK